MRTLSFVGPNGPYRILLQDGSSLEDRSLVVVTNGETSHWTIEVDESRSGTRTLAGMTRDGSGLWFELWLGSVPEVQYWADRRCVRADKAI
jgi:hypothetical protein